MPKLTHSKEVEEVIRIYLESKKCTLSPPKKQGQTGPDIIAKHGKSTWFVEVIGFQGVPSIRSREFYEAFFRIISRDRDNPDDTLVLALPMRFKDGMRQRKQQYPVAWDKLGKAFPNLRIWYADTEHNIVEQHSWVTPFD